jgi:hypothetical protein
MLGFQIHDESTWPKELENLEGVTRAVKKMNMKVSSSKEKWPPITYPVSNLSKYKQVPTENMWNALARLFHGKWMDEHEHYMLASAALVTDLF